MILLIHKLLHLADKPFDFDFEIGGLILLSIAFTVFNISGLITFKTLLVILILTASLYFGVLNSPYCYLRNLIKLKIVSRIFRKRKFICYPYFDSFFECWEAPDYPLLTLRNKNKGTVGIITENSIYLDEGCRDEYVLWGMKNIKYFVGLADFLRQEVQPEDNEEIIKRKLILRNLKI